MKRSNGFLSFLIVFFAAILALGASGALGEISDLFDEPVDTTAVTLPPIDTEPLPEGKIEPYYYSQLDETGKRMYKLLYDGVLDGGSSVTVTGAEAELFYRYDDYMNVVRALTYDNPAFFWLECGYSWKRNNKTLKIDVSAFPYWQYTLDKSEKMAELDARVAEVANAASAYPDHYERIKFVHDYLVANAYYDHDSLAEYPQLPSQD